MEKLRNLSITEINGCKAKHDSLEYSSQSHTNPGAYVLGTTCIIGIKMRFISCQMYTSEWNFKHMTSFFMSNFPVITNKPLFTKIVSRACAHNLATWMLVYHRKNKGRKSMHFKICTFYIDKYTNILNKKKRKTDVYSLVLLGKHWSNAGRGRKSGAAGSTVCFLCLVVFSLLVEEGSKVNVALGPEKEGM